MVVIFCLLTYSEVFGINATLFLILLNNHSKKETTGLNYLLLSMIKWYPQMLTRMFTKDPMSAPYP